MNKAQGGFLKVVQILFNTPLPPPTTQSLVHSFETHFGANSLQMVGRKQDTPFPTPHSRVQSPKTPHCIRQKKFKKTCICTHAHMHICAYMHMHTSIYAHMHIRICICTYAHMHSGNSSTCQCTSCELVCWSEIKHQHQKVSILIP